MTSLLVLAWPFLLTSEDIETRFVQVSPRLEDQAVWTRSPDQQRAVVLVHGFTPHLRRETVKEARFHTWQETGPLVEALSENSDVFSFAYGQIVPVHRIAEEPRLVDGVKQLRAMGYAELVLMGHSAGGLVVRQFIEDSPASGVTKVIQVCAPNAGSTFASSLRGPVRKPQESFLNSLTKPARDEFMKQRANKKIPPQVQFICVVCLAGTSGEAGEVLLGGDFVISDDSQWSPDLQEQGIPAIEIRSNHQSVMRRATEASVLASLISKDHSRWNGDRVAEERKRILRK